MLEDITAILDRITNGTQTDTDILLLSQRLNTSDESLLQLGKYNINIGQGQDIQIGDKFYLEWSDEAMQALIQIIQAQMATAHQPIGIPQNLPRSGVIEFVGRDAALATLHQNFSSSNQTGLVAIAGMGGIGKTELALQYALKYQQEYPGGICWLQVRGIDLGTQIVSYARAQLKLTPPNDLDLPAQVAFCWRQWLAGNVLVILDDVIDYQTIKPYLPPSHPRFKVLLTSRIRPGKSIQQLTLDVLDKESALDLLTALIGNERLESETDEAKVLCTWLGYLPLGIEIVGRYLLQNEDLSLEKILQRLEKKRLDAPAIRNTEDDMTAKLGVAAAFELSWDTLPKAARELGCLLSLFAASPISWSLVEQCEPDEDPENLEDLRDGKLLRLNLLQRTEQATYRLHPLMREFFQTKLPLCADVDEVKAKFCQTIVNVAQKIPAVLTQNDVLKIAVAIPHIAEAATTQNAYFSNANLMFPFEGLGRFYESQGFYDQAEPWYQLGCQTVEARLGSDLLKVAHSLSQLARIYRCQGRYAEAEPLFLRVLGIRQQQFRDAHPCVAETLHDLALLREEQGHYSEVEPLYVQALEMRQQIFGTGHPAVADTMSSLALFYNEQERYAEAESLLTEALGLRKCLLGTDHPYVADSMINLAACYSSQKRYAKAEILYLEAIALTERLVGKQHPDLATALNNLAYLYISQERFIESEPLFLQSVEILRFVVGDEHPNVATSLDNLASLYDMQGRSTEAELLYCQVIDMRKRLLGDIHPYVAFSLNNLAKLYYLQRRYVEAEPLYRQAIEILSSQLGSDHPITLKVYSNLQDLLTAQLSE